LKKTCWRVYSTHQLIGGVCGAIRSPNAALHDVIWKALMTPTRWGKMCYQRTSDLVSATISSSSFSSPRNSCLPIQNFRRAHSTSFSCAFGPCLLYYYFLFLIIYKIISDQLRKLTRDLVVLPSSPSWV